MNKPLQQHLSAPEICIRRDACGATCPSEAITHDENNVVVDASTCSRCMDCIAPAPTGTLDEWRAVNRPRSGEEQFGWTELPEQADAKGDGGDTETAIEATEEFAAALLEEAHRGAGGRTRPPQSASWPSVDLPNMAKPATATAQGNDRLTAEASDSDVRHAIFDLDKQTFPVLEGQSVGVLPPGTGDKGELHPPSLYPVASARGGERPNDNDIFLTVKREAHGVCSSDVCDLKKGDRVDLTGRFGATFLLPNDPQTRVLTVCTGTGAAP